MEREPPEVARRLMRAARSLNYNRELQPLVEERIERAEGTLRGYLLARGLTTLRLGAFRVEMDEDGGIELARLPMDEWQQMPLPQFTPVRRSGTNSGKRGASTDSGIEAGRREHREQARGERVEEIIYQRLRET